MDRIDEDYSPGCRTAELSKEPGPASTGELLTLGARLEQQCERVNYHDPASVQFVLMDILGSLQKFCRPDSKAFRVLGIAFCAIADLRYGVESPFLKAKKPEKGGRAPDPSDIWRLRAYVAEAIEFLVLGGMSKKDAVDMAARKYPNLHRLVRPRQKLRGCISTWHRDFMGDRVKHPGAAEMFNFAMRCECGRQRFSRDSRKRGKYCAWGQQWLAAANRQACEIIPLRDYST